jgi:RNA polymerase sigma-70 factor, ECF subfamily
MSEHERSAQHSSDAVAADFERHRPKLLSLAYRLLGRMGEAEEVVQDAFLRWFAADRETVHEPLAFLMTTVTRLALDRLKSAHARREHYVGPWLPEPVLTDVAPVHAASSLDALERRELISLGLLRLLERLSGAERGVFVLREAFDLSYEEIAEILGLTPANCRQLYLRAQKHLATDRTRFVTNADAHRRLLAQFHAAAREGNTAGLRQLLSEEVVIYNDGGGRVRAARNPIYGADRVARFYVGIAAKYPDCFGDARFIDVNASPALLLRLNGKLHVIVIDVENDLICNIYAVVNPDELAHLARHLDEPN